MEAEDKEEGVNRRDADIGDRLSESWWDSLGEAALGMMWDCETIAKLAPGCAARAASGGAASEREGLLEGRLPNEARVLAALQRIMDAACGKLAQEAQVLAEEFPEVMDNAYEIDDIYGEEE